MKEKEKGEEQRGGDGVRDGGNGGGWLLLFPLFLLFTDGQRSFFPLFFLFSFFFSGRVSVHILQHSLKLLFVNMRFNVNSNRSHKQKTMFPT